MGRRDHQQRWRDGAAERLKELSAVHAAARILQRDTFDLPAMLQEFAELLPPAFVHPELASARVRLANVQAATAAFGETADSLRVDFPLAGGQSGSIEVVYTDGSGDNGAASFVPEERTLLQTLAVMLRTFYDRQQSEAALRVSEERYRTFVEVSSLIDWTADAEGSRYRLPGWTDLTGQA
jgi:hypothetical protein